MIISKSEINGLEVINGENEHLRIQIAPDAGGKIISIFNKKIKKEFLWKNVSAALSIFPSGTDYDSNFFGGFDELIPNDVPENIDGISFPDHGELWTTRLGYELYGDCIRVYGILKLSGLYYEKSIRMNQQEPSFNLNYTIRNESDSKRHFLWKLHPALVIQAGDQLKTTAKTAKVVDPLYSRFRETQAFEWPLLENTDASVIAVKNGTVDFFYLYDLEKAEMSLKMDGGKYLFSLEYDKNIFPYQWYFASYGGFLDHYTVIPEPCTSMPILVNEARLKEQCCVLKPREEIRTTVKIYAGENQ
jgi:Domain of unknown function (DUF5107)